ncbi:hypothetical protein [uncultured Megasphaera sp.]
MIAFATLIVLVISAH